MIPAVVVEIRKILKRHNLRIKDIHYDRNVVVVFCFDQPSYDSLRERLEGAMSEMTAMLGQVTPCLVMASDDPALDGVIIGPTTDISDVIGTVAMVNASGDVRDPYFWPYSGDMGGV